MPASTPIARTKSAALARVLDAVPKGYTRWISGSIPAVKAEGLAHKFHEKFGIGCTTSQRITRRDHKIPNTLLVLYWPENAKTVEWLMLATNNKGDKEIDGEEFRSVTDKPRLKWIGYELIRHAAKTLKGKSKNIWTWKRSKEEMAEHYAVIAKLVNEKREYAITEYLQVLANQPGFHGVRAQTFEIVGEAIRLGYRGIAPHIYFMQKISHGERLILKQ